jgi:phosphoenolpyruvate carboxylase
MKTCKKHNKVHDIGIAIYSKTIEHIADMINQVASSVPKRRERMLHIGLFGYSRWIGETKLPRAIWFTASLYSLWIPPELIGTGRLIQELETKWLLHFVEAKYLNIKKDLAFAYKYLNKDNLIIASKQNPAFDDIIEDVRIIETYLWELADNTSWESIAHQQQTSSVMQLMLAWKDFKEPLINAAKIRKKPGIRDQYFLML